MLIIINDGWWERIMELFQLSHYPVEKRTFKIFAYSLYAVLFLILVCPQIAADLLENFQKKIDIFKGNFHNTISVYMGLYC